MADGLHPTLDQYLASFLLSEEAALAGVTRLGPKTVEARFIADRRLHELLRLYRSDLAIPIVPARLFAAHREFKRLCRAHARWPSAGPRRPGPGDTETFLLRSS